MTLYALKPAFQARLRPLVERLAARGVTANQVTLAAMIGSLVIGLAVAAASPARLPFLLLPVWLFARMALNAIDGMLAREFNQKSRAGALLNEIGDVVSDAALVLPFATLDAFGAFATGVVILLAAVSEYAGVLGLMIGASRRYDGPFGKSDRALAFGALGLYTGLGLPLASWFDLLMWAAAAALIVTILNRARAALKEGEGT